MVQLLLSKSFLLLPFLYDLHSIMVQLLSDGTLNPDNGYTFTFHYGSITIIEFCNYYLFDEIFTFHYGSITMVSGLSVYL